MGFGEKTTSNGLKRGFINGYGRTVKIPASTNFILNKEKMQPTL